MDHEHQVIVAARATSPPSDKQQAVAMVGETIGNTGAMPREVSADAGYYSAPAVARLQASGVDPFIAPEKTRHGTRPPPVPRGRIPRGLSARDRMRRKLQTKRGRQRYALRMERVEPVFGQIQQGRGFRQFLPVPATWPGKGQEGVVAGLRQPQPAQALPVRDLPARQETWQRPSRGRRRTARRRHHSDDRETGPTRAFSIASNGGRLLTQPQRQGQSTNPRTGC